MKALYEESRMYSERVAAAKASMSQKPGYQSTSAGLRPSRSRGRRPKPKRRSWTGGVAFRLFHTTCIGIGKNCFEATEPMVSYFAVETD